MIDGKFRAEGFHKCRKVIVDLANVAGKYEVGAFTEDWGELAIETYTDLDKAIDAYNKMASIYILTDTRPLKGRYATLRDDLKKALATGREAEAKNPEDGGTCNFDSAAIYLPRWRESMVEQAAKEAETSCFKWEDGFYVFSPNTRAQANARSRNAEAMTKALENLGYKVFEYQQMD